MCLDMYALSVELLSLLISIGNTFRYQGKIFVTFSLINFNREGILIMLQHVFVSL